MLKFWRRRFGTALQPQLHLSASGQRGVLWSLQTTCASSSQTLRRFSHFCQRACPKWLHGCLMILMVESWKTILRETIFYPTFWGWFRWFRSLSRRSPILRWHWSWLGIRSWVSIVLLAEVRSVATRCFSTLQAADKVGNWPRNVRNVCKGRSSQCHSKGITTSSKKLLVTKCSATSNKGIAMSDKVWTLGPSFQLCQRIVRARICSWTVCLVRQIDENLSAKLLPAR